MAQPSLYVLCYRVLIFNDQESVFHIEKVPRKAAKYAKNFFLKMLFFASLAPFARDKKYGGLKPV